MQHTGYESIFSDTPISVAESRPSAILSLRSPKAGQVIEGMQFHLRQAISLVTNTTDLTTAQLAHTMVSVQNYKSDKYYPKVVSAFDRILTDGKVVAPIDVLMALGNLNPKKCEDWRFGRVPYLEKVIDGSLPKLHKILNIIGFHAHDLDMKPSPTVYKKWGKGRRIDLKFTRNRIPKIEATYSKCFAWNRRLPYEEWKQAQHVSAST